MTAVARLDRGGATPTAQPLTMTIQLPTDPVKARPASDSLLGPTHWLRTTTLVLLCGGLAEAQGFGPFQQVTATARVPQDLYTCDLDGDGDLDLLTASNFDSKVAWYANNGSGGFGAQQVISTSLSGPKGVHAGDLDGDGAADVIACSVGNDRVVWHRNLGGGTFGAEQLISTQQPYPRDLLALDLDADGDLDVLSASDNGGGRVLWHENLGGGAFGADRVIATGGTFLSIAAGDLDGDGDLDLLAARSNEIAWHRNDGGGVFSGAQPLPAPGGTARCVQTADLDGDGDLDACFAAGNGFGWYANLGGGSFGAPQVLSSATTAQRVRAADLDGDGELDLLGAGSVDSRLFWHRNLGGGAFSGSLSIYTASPADTLEDIELADIDGDGDADLLTGGYYFFGTTAIGRVVRFMNLMGPFVSPGSAYCFGDGSGTSCPCGGVSGAGQGCPSSSGAGGAVLEAVGNATLSNDTFELRITGVPGAKPGIVLRGANQVNGGAGNPVGEGLLCASGQTARSSVKITSAAGSTTYTEFRPGQSFGSTSYGAGAVTNYQFWYRDTANTCNGAGFNFTNGWTVTWQN